MQNEIQSFIVILAPLRMMVRPNIHIYQYIYNICVCVYLGPTFICNSLLLFKPDSHIDSTTVVIYVDSS